MLTPEKCWHQKMADTRNALLPEKCRHQKCSGTRKYRGNGECETGKEKWKEVGMGHKWRFAWTRRLRRMMGVHLECAIMIRGRERISLVVVYRLGLSVALKSMYSSVYSCKDM
jgi:hypothetical protein